MAEPRHISFVDRREPPLEAGTYSVTVTQTVSRTGGFTERFTSTRRLYVRGERFALDAGDVIAVFPPAGSAGEYGHVLPHIVLGRHTLPWERPLAAGAHAPWLAVLLFDAASAPPVQSLRVQDLVTPPQGTVSYGIAGTFGPQLGEQASDGCQAIDIPIPDFRRIAPRAADLAYLAHVRAVPAPGKAAGAAVECAVVVGHRLPAEGSAVAHLVSLEGLGEFLPGGSRSLPPDGALRLITLRTWTFTSHDAPRTFKTYFTTMTAAPLQRPFTQHARAVVVPGAGAVASAFAMGYTALDHRLRSGDRTVSWYRGPLLPYTAGTIVPPPAEAATIGAADEAVRYDAATGMFDVTYAAAWETGRLAAIASQAFSTALVAWKRAAKERTLHAVGTTLVARRFRGLRERAAAAHGATSGVSALTGFLASLAPEPSMRLTLGDEPAVHDDPLTLLPRRAQLTMAAGLSPARLAELHAGTTVPAAIATFLQQLSRLQGIPFAALVPDASMLPPESIRFFTVDRNWLTAMVEGACSLGRASSFDRSIDDALASRLYDAAQIASPATGFLVRSAAVDAWPGLEVSAYDSNGTRIGAPAAASTLAADVTAGATTLTLQSGDGDRFPDAPFELTIAATGDIVRCTTIDGDLCTLAKPVRAAAPAATAVVLRHPRLRFERIGPSLLLFMTAGALAKVQIHEPGEGLHFGFEQESMTKQLRYAAATDGIPAGTPIKADRRAPVPVTFRDAEMRTLDVAALADAIRNGPYVVDPDKVVKPGEPPFSSAEFALQLAQGVESVTFTIGGGA